MKKFLLISLIALAGFSARAQTADYAGYLAALDTMTNAETVNHEVLISGSRSAITFQVNVLKISGTLAGTINLYGSTDGVNYRTVVLSTAITIADASANYVFALNANNYKKYKLTIAETGTNSASYRVYLLYRK